MENVKIQLGTELNRELYEKPDIDNLATWAYRKLWLTGLDYPSDIEDALNSIAFMEMGEEFVLSMDRLKSIADKWIEEGEYEELGLPKPEVRKSAEDIGKGWLYCPICHEAWESKSTYAMVECPQCKNKLHNPRYVPQHNPKAD